MTMTPATHSAAPITSHRSGRCPSTHQPHSIDIDEEHRTPLVRKGVFGVSRNPIFLGMMLTLLGLFLVIPNAVTLLALVLGVVLIQIQVRLEEEFLSRVHGDDYADYRRDVRRWL